ncbi:MAG: hypothetical protein LC802_24105 [Acidobacteria bacterium]|nr:hypothetical protein [Acidobacteriota bacterium]
MRIKFTDFERLKGTATVVEEGNPDDVKDNEREKPAATPPPPPPAAKPKP